MIAAGLLVVLFLVLAAEFVNGWTDAPNAIVTIVSTKVMSPRAAIVMAVVLNVVGTMIGTEVATTIGKDIVEDSAITLPAIAAAMITIVAWGTFAGKTGMPVSKSHALLAGIAGAAVAGGGFGALLWSGWVKVIIGMSLALVVGFVGAYLIVSIIMALAAEASPTKAKRIFDNLQKVSAGSMALSHAMNDGQKFIGIFSMVLQKGGVFQKFTITRPTILICAAVMGLGTAFGGWKIMKTVGQKMTTLTSWQGFAAESAASITIFGASIYGVPLSTTHTINSAIVGSAAAKRIRDVRWTIVRSIFLAWVLTFPICGVLAFIAATIANRLA